MRRSFALLLLAALLVAGALALPRGGTVDTLASREEAAEELQEVTEPASAMLARQLGGSEVLPTQAFGRARAQAVRLGRQTRRAAPEVAGERWELVGPTDIGGRVLDVVIDAEDPQTIWAAAASGGVQRSTDGGRTFHARWPDDETQAIGALAQAPDGTLYAGTGETGPGGGSLTYGGRGVFKSEDRGRTWEQLKELRDTSRISRIVVDPGNAKRIWVAASGNLFRAGGERGLYRSDDGGRSFKLVLQGANGTTGATDIAVDPKDPKHVFAAMWDHKRGPNEHSYQGVGSGLFRSTDGGETWTRTGGPTLASSPALGRIGVAISPSTPKVVYAIAQVRTGRTPFLYKTTDGGTTWTQSTDANIAQSGSSFGWWFGRLWVSPDDPNDLFIAGVGLLRSKNGGQSTTVNNAPHADQHAMAFDPRDPERVFLGNDGGVYRSEDGGTSFEFAEHQAFSQLYSLDVSEQDQSRQVAGLQDNGSNRSYGGPEEGRWDNYVGGDGLRTLIHPTNQQIVFGCSQYGGCAKSTNGGNSTSSFSAEVVSARKNWFTPIEFDMDDPKVMYTGGELMSKSTDTGDTWTLTSPDLSNGPQPDPDPDYRTYGSLTTISPRGQVVYAGTDDGNLWVNRQAGAITAWTRLTDPDLPKGAWITRVQQDPADSKTVYVTYSGFRSGEEATYLFRSTDGGASFDNITGDLPRAPLNDVNVVGDLLVVASDVGVYASADEGATWRRVGKGLPLAPVHELRYIASSGELYAATFGRSMWKVDLPDASAF